MPLDFEPTAEGNVELVELEHVGIVAIVHGGTLALELMRAEGRRLYMPHHATCPHGRAWQRR